MSLQADIDRAVATLGRMSKEVADNRQRIAAKGGTYMTGIIRPAAPVSARPHYRYATPKLLRGLRAPKGMGVKVATYLPGNLAKSARVLKFRRAKSKVFVGARVAKGNASGVFGQGARVDGYYLAMVESGPNRNPFWRAAVASAENGTLSVMLREWQKLVIQYDKKA